MNIAKVSLIGAQLRQARIRAKKTSKYLANESALILNPEQKEQIRSVWGDIHIDKRWIAYYNQFRQDGAPWSACYVPANLQYGVLDMFYTDYRKCRVMEDKNWNQLLFDDIRQPHTILRHVKNLKSCSSVFLDENYRLIDRSQVLRILSSVGDVICKPSIESGGGRNIAFLDRNQAPEKRLAAIDGMPNAIVQEIVGQHPSLSSLNTMSLNTTRYVTFITKDGDVRLLSAIVRMGANNSRVDNACAGGMFCGVSDTGQMRAKGFNLKGECYTMHPDSKIGFDGYMIPSYATCRQLVLSLAPRLYNVSRLVSWDLAISEDGEPVLIEANMTYGGCNIPQMANGPLYGDLTGDVIKEVFASKLNRLYAWLI